MFLKTPTAYFRLASFFSKRHIHNRIFQMDKAYLRTLNDGNQFLLTFHYSNPEQRVNREFNFCRQLTENLETFVNRVVTNVEKVVNRKKKKVKNKDSENAEVENNSTAVKVAIFNNDNEVPVETLCSEVFQDTSDTLYLSINNMKYEIIVNSPWIEVLALPSSILATFMVYPAKFDASFTDIDMSEFVWYRSNDKKIWTEVGTGYIYVPNNEDVGYFLKLCCTPKNQRFEGPKVEVVSLSPVEAGPGICPFENRHQFTETRLNGNEFRVVTYNILADLYCALDFTREVLHPYCPAYALSIDYRKQLILKEIAGYNADIICLQEVDRKVYNYDLSPILSKLGYASHFAPKGGDVAEGLALFYNVQRFTLLKSERYIFSEQIAKADFYAEVWEKIVKNQQLADRLLARANVLQINVLETLENNEIFVVANTHLYFHPDADHIRLLHAGFAIKYLEKFVADLKAQYSPKRVSLIFCGDFNTVPECGIYKLFTTGYVPKDCVDYSSNVEESVSDVELKHNISLASACGTPKYTNFTAGFADCLDYIFYETSNLSVSQVIPLPTHEELVANTALPSIVCPSDHIALVADLKLI